MSVATQPLSTAGTSVHIGDARDDLATILQPECAASIWRRQVPRDVQTMLDGLPAERLPRGRVILPMEEVGLALEELFDASDLPKGADRDWLKEDITSLADMFANLMMSPYLRLRLDAVTTNACRRFHIDALTARLVCSYRGTGTQYGISDDGQDPNRVFTVQTGAPILLRGTLWPEKPASGLLHRSPPIEGTGETRLVLVLDPIFDPDIEV